MPTGAPARRRVGELPGTPGRAVAIGAVSGVVVVSILGALAGWGIVDTGCSGNCGDAAIWGAIAGVVAGAIGAAIVAVAVLRARFQWRVPRHDGDRHPSDSLRNGSA